MTLAIGFDSDSGTIVISGNGVFPARSLAASISATLNGYIQINDIAGRGEQHVAWDDVTSLDGSYAPASMDDALAYLRREFNKSIAVGETFGIPIVAGTDLTQGVPVAVSRATGQLMPARADTYVLAFVAGVAAEATAQGHTAQPTHGAVTLPDWTEQTGAPALQVGQLYFVGSAGGLTTTPDYSAACVACVGLATTPQTLVVEPSAPILL